MYHTLVIGSTGMGKSLLCKWTCASITHSFRRDRVRTVALNPRGETDWQCHFQSRDPFAIDAFCKARCRKAVFLDEADTALGRSMKERARFDHLTTCSRHDGSSVWVIAHKRTLLTPAMRSCCTQLWLFSCELSDSKAFADSLGRPELATAHTLPPLHFFIASKSAPTRYGRLVIAKREIEWLEKF